MALHPYPLPPAHAVGRPSAGLLAVRRLVWRVGRGLARRPRLRTALHACLAASGAVAIAWLQSSREYVAAPLFGLFFWCLVVTRTFGALPAAVSVLVAALVGNVALLYPRGRLTLTGESGLFSALFVLFAGIAVGMFASIRRDVVRQRKRLAHEQHIVREHAELARALSRALTARDVFLAVAGHELRSPITAVLMQAQVQQRRLAKQGEAAQTQAQAWQRQVHNLQRLLALVDGVLDVSRINSGQLTLQREEVDLARLMREVSGRYSELAAKAQCTLEVTQADEAPVVGAFDRLRLEQVVGNLLSNAFKYGGGGPVELALAREGEWAVLRVRDHGDGIGPEDKKRIFDCFERVTADKTVSGLGLGLWIVRQIVSAHRGSIEVDSEPGQGATFTIKLPLRPPRRA